MLSELSARNVKFMIIGMGAAVLQGAPVMTDDIDLWFASLSDPSIDEAVRQAGGMLAWRASPPMIVGQNLDHVDLVFKPNGLLSFDEEYANAVDGDVDGISVKLLPLERIIVSKQAANRPKDIAALPALKATMRAQKG